MSNIEWTDATWNPVVGCTPVSPGCLNCYAATMARRLEKMRKPEYQPRDGIRIAEVKAGRAVFTGEVRCLDDRLAMPLRWRKPRLVFVNSMSDLFHEAVPFEFVDKVFAVMALCPQHVFQVLTKRPERMAEYLNTPGRGGFIWADASQIDGRLEDEEADVPYASTHSNVWLGTSVENQATADERIPHLLRCPAAVRFLSCEPLIGSVDLSAFMGGQYVGLPGDVVHPNYNFGLHWIIVGGESGAHARPCNVEWIRWVVKQCQGAGVPCFVKQVGRKPFLKDHAYCPTCREWHHERGWDCAGLGPWLECRRCGKRVKTRTGAPQRLNNRKGGDPTEWPADLRVREMPA